MSWTELLFLIVFCVLSVCSVVSSVSVKCDKRVMCVIMCVVGEVGQVSSPQSFFSHVVLHSHVCIVHIFNAHHI